MSPMTMILRPLIFGLLLAFYLSTTLSTGKEEELSEYVVSECYGDIFNFDCGRGNKIRINKDFFGYSKSRTCRYSQGECIISNPKSNSLIHRFCTGHRVCTYYLVERRGCGGSFSNYQQVEYQCIPDSMVTNICSTVDYKASSTYIASPNFPENYPPNLNCRCMVSATSPKAKVRMEIVYLAIKYTHPCQDWLSIGLRRTCGTTMDLFQGRRIPIEFHSDNDDSHSGFWLHFKSSIPGEQVHVQCGNITFRPSKKPDINHEHVSGSEGGADKSDQDADTIHRSPRPEDKPQERALHPSGKVIRPSRTNPRSGTNSESEEQHGIGDDPASGKARASSSTSVRPSTTKEGFLSGSEDMNSVHGSSVTKGVLLHNSEDLRSSTTVPLLDSARGNSRDKFMVGEEGEGGKEESGGSTNNDDIYNVPGRARTENPFSPRGNMDDSEVYFGISTKPLHNDDYEDYDDDDDHDDGDIDKGSDNDKRTPLIIQNNSTRNKNHTISKLDDKGTWGKPPDNHLTKEGKVLSDNNSFSDDKSFLDIDTTKSDGAANPGRMSGSGITEQSTTDPGFSTTGIIIVCICIAVGLLLVCAVLLIVYFKRHGTRDEETQTPGQKPASDGDSGQGLLVAGSGGKSKDYYANKADKSLQIDLDSDYDDTVTFSAHISAMKVMDDGEDESSMYSGLYSDPNCKGVQVTFNSLAKARFRDKKRKRTKMLIGKSSSSGIDVKGCDSIETTEGSSCESVKPPFHPISDFSDPGSFTCSEPELGVDHKRSLASMSQYSEVTLMPENAVLPSNNEFYDSFSDPEWDQKSAISI